VRRWRGEERREGESEEVKGEREDVLGSLEGWRVRREGVWKGETARGERKERETCGGAFNTIHTVLSHQNASA